MVSGESGEVSGEVWLERILELVSEYAIWNPDETGFFGEPSKSKDLVRKGKSAELVKKRNKE